MPHAPARARRAALGHLSELLRLTPTPQWATPTLIAIGLAASLAETLGITLIVAFLYAALGQAAEAPFAVGGVLGRALARAHDVFGSPAQMALGILLLIVARAALAHTNRLLGARVSEDISQAARNRLHEQYLTVSYGLMQRHEQAQLMEVLGTESWLIAHAYRSLTRILIGVCSISCSALSCSRCRGRSRSSRSPARSCCRSACIGSHGRPRRWVGASSVCTRSSASTC